MDRFYKMHPIVQFIYFLFVFIFTLSLSNPVFSALSLVCAVLYDIRLRKKEALKSIALSFSLIVLVSIFNMLFSHYGNDILFTIGETDFTLEALFYGFNQGMVLSAVIIRFVSFSMIFDSEKIIYIFRFAPKSALIFSMVTGFIPRFKRKLNDIRAAQLALRGGQGDDTIKQKFKTSLNNFSALISYCLESSIITADSMNARGYNPKAVRASRYRISFYDIFLVLLIIILSAIILYSKISGRLLFIFEPEIRSESFSTVAFVSALILNLLPLMTDFIEDIQWKISNAKS